VKQGFIIEALNSAHNRKGFSSGVEPLDRYFRELVTQDVKRRVSNGFVALDAAGAIAGYYTFAAASLPLTELSADEKQRLPRYALLPAGLIGRLAVDQKYQGLRLGSALIMDAAARAARGTGNICADNRCGCSGAEVLRRRLTGAAQRAACPVLEIEMCIEPIGIHGPGQSSRIDRYRCSWPRCSDRRLIGTHRHLRR